MDLSIIIVNWNVKDLLEKCLTSIYQETQDIDFEVIVVDNASADGSVEMVKKKFPQAKLITNKENKWFAGGNNQGLQMARGDLILLLNPDTVVLDRAVDKMMGIMNCRGFLRHSEQQRRIPRIGALNKGILRLLAPSNTAGRQDDAEEKDAGKSASPVVEQNNRIGILGCKLLNSDMTIQPSCRKLPGLSSQILILLKLHNFFPNLKPIRKYYMTDYQYDDTREVEQVMGACLMVRKEITDQIGGLDERYGSIFEEVDFCQRVLSGSGHWKIYFTDKAEIIHHKGQSFRQRKIITNQKNFNYALLRYFRKYKPFWQYLIILALWPVSMLLAATDQLMILIGIRKFKEKFKKREY